MGAANFIGDSCLIVREQVQTMDLPQRTIVEAPIHLLGRCKNRRRSMAETTTKVPVKFEKKAVGGATPMMSWEPFEALRREIDRAFGTFGGGSWPFSRGRTAFDLPWPQETQWSIDLAVDISEKDKEYEISAELPGLSEKDVEVKLSNGNLTIKGEKREEKEERDKDYYLCGRRFGSFVRSFGLPEGVDTSKIDATFANGVLRIKLPKTAEAQKAETKITVKAA
jgi:HSP20 family protein